MMNVKEILCDLIGLKNTFIGEAPVDIDDCQWVMDMSGPSDDHFDGSTYDNLGIRVYVRGISNEESNNRMYDIYKKLKSYVGANYVIVIRRTPYYVGRDVKYRNVYGLNIEFQLGGY